MSMFSLRRSLGLRLILIGVLTLVLLVPMGMVRGLIREREGRRSEAVADIASKWGGMQVLAGPILTVPYEVRVEEPESDTRPIVVMSHGTRAADPESDTGSIVVTPQQVDLEVAAKEPRFEKRQAHFLPDSLRVTGTVAPEIRYRGIYEVVVYTAKLSVTGSFGDVDFARLNADEERVLWEDAFVTLAISDLKGIRAAIDVYWDGSPCPADTGMGAEGDFGSGVAALLGVSPETGTNAFSVDLELAGSGELMFEPLGKMTDVAIESDWPDPSFVGGFLPNEEDVSEDGFSAAWHVSHLNRNYPRQWVGRPRKSAGAAFGVRLFNPVNEYQQATRAAKYAILCIVLTFLAFFMTEVLTRRPIHPIQYLFVGLGLVLFYSLLVSLSEHLLFGLAYLLASAALVLLVAAYARTIMRSSALGGVVGAVLALLYLFLYIVIRQSDYALLLGNIGLLVTLAFVMYLTRGSTGSPCSAASVCRGSSASGKSRRWTKRPRHRAGPRNALGEDEAAALGFRDGVARLPGGADPEAPRTSGSEQRRVRSPW